MIRDPSDGSVRETQKSAPVRGGSLPSGESDPSVTLDYAGADTGLPITTDPREIERLNRSRDWLKTYRKGET
jgi:hypothetical protein